MTDDMQAAGSAVVVQEPADIVAELLGGGQVVTEDPLEVQKRIMVRILESRTPEEILNPKQPEPWQTLIGEPVQVRAVSWNDSSKEGASGKYALVEAVRRETGEVVQLTCGGANVITQLRALELRGALPQWVRLVESRNETANGNRPLWLNPA
jgi:hypothetical protein